MLADKIKLLLPDIISPTHSAFVGGRNITENSTIVHEAIHTLDHKKGKNSLMMIKMEIEKAYDRMEWGFLRTVLFNLGFAEVWINWVMECVIITSMMLLLNSSPFGNFVSLRGLR